MAEIKKTLGSVLYPRGTYSADATYYKNNVVQYNNASYYLKMASAKGVAPGSDATKWGVMASGTELTDEVGNSETKAVSQKGLALAISKGGVVNISAVFKKDTTTPLTLQEAAAAVPQYARAVGFEGKFLTTAGVKSYRYVADSIDGGKWGAVASWVNIDPIYTIPNTYESLAEALKVVPTWDRSVGISVRYFDATANKNRTFTYNSPESHPEYASSFYNLNYWAEQFDSDIIPNLYTRQLIEYLGNFIINEDGSLAGTDDANVGAVAGRRDAYKFVIADGVNKMRIEQYLLYNDKQRIYAFYSSETPSSESFIEGGAYAAVSTDSVRSTDLVVPANAKCLIVTDRRDKKAVVVYAFTPIQEALDALKESVASKETTASETNSEGIQSLGTFASFKEAALAVPTKDRKSGYLLKYFDSTLNKAQLFYYQRLGNDVNYESIFTNQSYWANLDSNSYICDLGSREYASLSDAAKSVGQGKRIPGLIMSFKNSSTGKGVLAQYVFSGENYDYMSNFGDESKWNILTNGKDHEDLIKTLKSSMSLSDYKSGLREYASFVDAARAETTYKVAGDCRVPGFVLRYFDTTENKVKMYVYNHKGTDATYDGVVTNIDNWIDISGSSASSSHSDSSASGANELYYTKGFPIGGIMHGETGTFVSSSQYNYTSGVLSLENVSRVEASLSSTNLNNSNAAIVLLDEELNVLERKLVTKVNAITEFSFDIDEQARYIVFNTAAALIESASYKLYFREGTAYNVTTNNQPLILPGSAGEVISSHKGFRFGPNGKRYTWGSPYAYMNAAKVGYKWWEIDIQATSDDEWVVVHDEPINVLLKDNGIIDRETKEAITPVFGHEVAKYPLSDFTTKYVWYDGGRIMTLRDCLYLARTCQCNVVLEFKSEPKNFTQMRNLKSACLEFGINNIVYNATSTNYAKVFDCLTGLGIYYRGKLSTTTVDDDSIEALFSYAKNLGNCSVTIYSTDPSLSVANNPKVKELRQKYHLQISSVGDYMGVDFVSDVICRRLDYYPESKTLISEEIEIDNEGFAQIASFAIDQPGNVSISVHADSGIQFQVDSTNLFYGDGVPALALDASTHAIKAKGSGKIYELGIEYALLK